MSAVEINLAGVLSVGVVSADLDVTCQVTGFVLAPTSQQTQSPGTMCQAPQTKLFGVSSWVIQWAFLQDWSAELDSLSQFMLANQGTDVFFEFVPADAAVPTAAGQFTAAATDYGGAYGQPWSHTSPMPVVGQPAFTPQA